MPAVDQPHLNDPLELRRNTIARNTALAAIVISAFSTLAYAVSGIVQDDVRSLILMSTSLLFTIAALIALLWIQRGKITRGIWILVLTSSIAFSVPTFLYETIGLIQGPLFLMLVGLFVLQTVAERKPRAQMIITGFAISTLNVLIDAFWPYERPVASASAWGVRIVLFLAILVYVLILSRQLRNVNLRTKITIFFAAVSLLAILVISAINISTTRTILLSTAQENLETAAANLANELDNWIVTSLTGIRAEAQNPLFVKALMSPSAESVRQDALQALIALRNKNPIFIEAYSLLDSTGKIYLSTDLAEIGLSEANRDYFLSALQQGLPTLSLWYVENRFYLANPIRDPDNKVIGVLRARYSASLFQQFVAQAKGLGGEGSFAILVDNNLVILAHGQYPHLIFKSIVPLDAQVLQRWQEEGRFWPGEATSFSLDLFDVARQLNEGRTSFLATDAYGTQQQGAIQQLKQQPWKVVFVQPRSILIRPVLQQIRQSFLTSALILILTFYAAYSLSRVITMPVTRLTETARQITQGHLEYQAEVSSNDEIGQLAQAFNLMTAQLRDLVNTLEQRVQERTRNIERRALLLQAAVEVGQAAIQTRDIQSLLSRITHLISQRFGFYHVGIFLLDERGEYAVLRAANSEGGQRMLARGHKLRVGQTGIVGYVTGRGEARIALDVGADAVFFDNPDLPNTRSEMALPLMVGDTILGALDVQSTEEAAFQEEDIATLQVMANQIAIAIDNARLFAENQAALEAIRRAYGEASRKAWQEWLLEHASVGYLVSANDRLWPVSAEEEEPAFQQAMQQSQPILASDGKTLFVPILMRGQAIGGLRLVKPEKATWDDEEIEIVQAMVEQLSAALESARLFEEVAARAERERTVAEVTTAIRSVADPETMLRIAMEELKRALNADEVAIRPYNSQKT